MYSGNQGAGGTPVGGHCTAVLPGGENPSGVAQSGGQDDQVGHRPKRERKREKEMRKKEADYFIPCTIITLITIDFLCFKRMRKDNAILEWGEVEKIAREEGIYHEQDVSYTFN